jgi:hypothetical protein
MTTTFVWTRSSIAVLFLSAGFACRDMGPGLPVTISAERSSTFSTSVDITPSNDAIRVTGGYSMGGCQEITAAAEFNGGVVDVRISNRVKKNLGNVSCPDVLVPFTYEAIVSGLAPGVVHVRVEHSGDTYGPNGTVADKSVIIE